MAKKNNYTSEQIVVLEGLAPVRKRPAMYIGTTSSVGLHHCLYEIVDNSIDEALGGFANNVWVVLHKDHSISVADDGRGFPIDVMPKYGKSALEILMTKLHAGGKFEGQAYKVSGGLHGVGSSVVNALSEWLRMEIRRDGKVYTQEYRQGAPQSDISTAKNSKVSTLSELVPVSVTGSTTTFKPDPTIFKETVEFSPKTIKKSLRDRAYLVSGLKFHFYNELDNSQYHFYFEGGIVSLVKSLGQNRNVLHPPILLKGQEDDKEIEVAIQYNDGTREAVSSFVNIINTAEGGTHLSGFKTALTRSIKDYAQKAGLLKNGKTGDISGEDTREGLTAVISLKMPSKELQFEGQTKGKLGNSEIQPFVAKVVKKELDTYFEEHPNEAKMIVSKIMITLKARNAARAAREAVMRKGVFDSMGLPGKLSDCQSKSPEESEIFIVEGDSAGGSAKQGRDRRFQAILPLRGKILNTEKARLDKIIEFAELKDLVVALGMGIGETVNPSKLRYHRVIIMTDADVDGAHIATLLLTFFYRHLPEVIEGGYLYLAQPPLYKITIGKDSNYVYTEEDKDLVLAKASGGVKPSLQRYKGLGEMNPEQLWETTMNPQKRIMKQIGVEDAQMADETFEILMGADVPPRRHFIQTNAKMAELDI
ncbi:MAG: DNA topoisomerase subunit B [Patescibacteria group bacterium]